MGVFYLNKVHGLRFVCINAFSCCFYVNDTVLKVETLKKKEMTQRHLLKRRVDFVTPRGLHGASTSSFEIKNSQPSKLSGEEAKNIYLNIINSVSEPDQKKPLPVKTKYCHKKDNISSKQVKRVRKKEMSKLFEADPIVYTPTSFLMASQNGDLRAIAEMIKLQPSLKDEKDNFGWTGLMVSSHAGHFAIVKFLLKNGSSWFGILDDSGRDAYQLACLGGHANIAHFLLHHRSLIPRERMREMTEEALRVVKRERLWCKDCNEHYYATADGREANNGHRSSVPHQLSKMNKSGLPDSGSSFFLSSKNAGYKLLKRQGWDEQSGLGPEGEGKKFPVKTVLKRDRKGLGLDRKNVAKVTHFAANDNTSVARVKRKSKREKSVAEEKEKKFKEFAMDFRRSFH